MRTRAEVERGDARLLSPWAQSSSQTRGRALQDEIPSDRTEYQLDRDRIVHSRWFARLDGKSFAFLSPAGDAFRSQLAFRQASANIARRLARGLGLNEDLAESIVLARGLGAPPFGHAGVEALERLLRPHGGFSLLRQSLRVALELETQYPTFNGLNLSWETLEGIAHVPPGDPADPAAEPWQIHPQPSLEAQAAALAESLALTAHGLSDALDAGLIGEADLQDLPLWQDIRREALKTFSRLDADRALPWIARCLVDHLVRDAIAATAARIESAGLSHPDDARRLEHSLVAISDDRRPAVQEFAEFIQRRVYLHHDLANLHHRSRQCLEQLHGCLAAHEHLLPPAARLRIKKLGVHRTVGDYLASLGDRTALAEHARLVGGASALNSTGLEQPSLF